MLGQTTGNIYWFNGIVIHWNGLDGAIVNVGNLLVFNGMSVFSAEGVCIVFNLYPL